MVSRRNYLTIAMMFVILLFMFQFTGVMKEQLSEYESNEYADDTTTSFQRSDAFLAEQTSDDACEVIYVGDAISGFGLMMLVRHAGGNVTAYAHLEDALADRGDKVTRGQPIARAGSSGNATEPQLHFQLRQGRRTLDPVQYLPR